MCADVFDELCKFMMEWYLQNNNTTNTQLRTWWHYKYKCVSRNLHLQCSIGKWIMPTESLSLPQMESENRDSWSTTVPISLQSSSNATIFLKVSKKFARLNWKLDPDSVLGWGCHVVIASHEFIVKRQFLTYELDIFELRQSHFELEGVRIFPPRPRSGGWLWLVFVTGSSTTSWWYRQRWSFLSWRSLESWRKMSLTPRPYMETLAIMVERVLLKVLVQVIPSEHSSFIILLDRKIALRFLMVLSLLDRSLTDSTLLVSMRPEFAFLDSRKSLGAFRTLVTWTGFWPGRRLHVDRRSGILVDIPYIFVIDTTS